MTRTAQNICHQYGKYGRKATQITKGQNLFPFRIKRCNFICTMYPDLSVMAHFLKYLFYYCAELTFLVFILKVVYLCLLAHGLISFYPIKLQWTVKRLFLRLRGIYPGLTLQVGFFFCSLCSPVHIYYLAHRQ